MVKKNTVEVGDELRDRVYRLCVAAGRRNVEREYPLSGKKVDVYFEDVRGFDGLKRFAVECKNYAKPLGEREWESIYSGYHSRRNAFDRLLVITANGVTDNFRQGVEANKDWMTHLTWQQFLYKLIDFRSYFQSLPSLFKNDRLDKYYIGSSDTEGNDLEELTHNWIAGNSNQPIAFLAGYGMGKSSFAKYLSSDLASKFEQGQFERIPVCIKLGGLYDKQNIESLITHYFTSEHQISDITPSLFKEMNRLGLLLIIFDGFDEMKHGMTQEDFKSVFSQIKKLVVGKSRVMVLGRPSALISEDDRCVLFGQPDEKGGKLITAVQNAVTFSEIKIAELSDDKLKILVPKYLLVLNEKIVDEGRQGLSQEKIDARANEILLPSFLELIRRPVHADMLCTIAMYNPDRKLDQTSTFELYSSFVSLIIEREVGKGARQAIGQKDREKFVTSVAWEFWPEKGLNGFTLSQLKNGSVYFPSKVRPTDDIHREMLVGSLLEQKDGQLYYFSHRSFQEFLVAKHIICAEEFRSEINKVNNEITVDVLKFVHESDDLLGVAKRLFDALVYLDKEMSSLILDIFDKADDKGLLSHIKSFDQKVLCPKQCFLLAKLLWRQESKMPKIDQMENFECRGASLLGMLACGEANEKRIRTILGFILVYAKSIIDRADVSKNGRKNQIVLRDQEEILWAEAIMSLSFDFNELGEFNALNFDVFETAVAINSELKIFDALSYPIYEDVTHFSNLDPIIHNAIQIVLGSGYENDRRHIDYRRALIQFLRTNPNRAAFVFEKKKELGQNLTKPRRKTLTLNKVDS